MMNAIKRTTILFVGLSFLLLFSNTSPGNAQSPSDPAGTYQIYLPLVTRAENYTQAKLVITDNSTGQSQEILVQAIAQSDIPSVDSSPVVFIGSVFEYTTQSLQKTNTPHSQSVQAVIKYDPYWVAEHEMDTSGLTISCQ